MPRPPFGTQKCVPLFFCAFHLFVLECMSQKIMCSMLSVHLTCNACINTLRKQDYPTWVFSARTQAARSTFLFRALSRLFALVSRNFAPVSRRYSGRKRCFPALHARSHEQACQTRTSMHEQFKNSRISENCQKHNLQQKGARFYHAKDFALVSKFRVPKPQSCKFLCTTRWCRRYIKPFVFSGAFLSNGSNSERRKPHTIESLKHYLYRTLTLFSYNYKLQISYLNEYKLL